MYLQQKVVAHFKILAPLSTNLAQPGDSEVTVFRSSTQVATYHLPNHITVEASHGVPCRRCNKRTCRLDLQTISSMLNT